MIKIITEAKQDYENLINAIMKANPFWTNNDQNRDLLRNNIIKRFNELKGFLPVEQRDIYYWIKKIEQEGYKGYEQLIQTLNDVKAQRMQAQAKKEFVKIFPSNIVRRFEQNTESLGQIDRSYQRYSYWVMQTKVDGEETVLSELEKLLRRFGYSPEEQAEIEAGSELLFNYDGFDVYKITNALAAEYYGQNTGWCISGKYPGHETNGEKYFGQYLNDYSQDAYYFIIKNFKQDDEEDYCVLFGENEEDNPRIWEGTSEMDEELEEHELNDTGRQIVNQLREKVYGNTLYPITKDSQVKFIEDYIYDDMDLLSGIIHLTETKMWSILKNKYQYTELKKAAERFFSDAWNRMTDKQKVGYIIVDVPYLDDEYVNVNSSDPSTYHVILDDEQKYKNAWIRANVSDKLCAATIVDNVMDICRQNIIATLKAFDVSIEDIVEWAVYEKDLGIAICKKIVSRKRGD